MIAFYIRIIFFLAFAPMIFFPLYALAESQSVQTENQEGSGLFKGLKEKFQGTGETQQAPSGITDRLREDAQKIGAWEYRVVSLPSTQDADLEKKLNELGLERWEAFSVQRDEETLRVFLKRPASTYLKAIPMSEYLRLIPKAEQGDRPSP